jgi:hypothetical protein
VHNLPRASSDAPLRIGAKPREPPFPLELELIKPKLPFLVRKLLFQQQEQENVQAVLLTGRKVSVCYDLCDSESNKANKLHRKKLAFQEKVSVTQNQV